MKRSSRGRSNGRVNWAILFPLGGTKTDENHEETHQLQALPKIKCAHLDGHYQFTT